ncbi:MAG: TonB-dependent receptor, partial [Pseudomonadales bacterium]|nr:TonB-dependent receptor [Pseudomonadales bacterium]NIX09179.1 TonB-dependent receptor [Pseudomonadales bacterium]
MIAFYAWPDYAVGNAVSFDIPKQRADLALIAFAEQADRTLLFSFDETKEKTANRLSGTYEVVAALELLLDGTGLSVSMGNRGQLTVAEHSNSSGETEVDKRKSVLSGVAAVVGVLLGGLQTSTPALAAETSDQRILEEILVTGTRQVTELQTTAIAITNLSEAQLEQSFTRDLRGVADLVPNLIIQNVTPWHSAASIGIRGTGTGDIITTVDSPIGVVVDDFVLPHVQSQLLDPFDLEGVEVLRGPQGTLFGKNTTGGVIILRSKRPEHNEFNGKLQAMVGSFDRREFRGSVNIPLIDDTLSFRLMFSDQKSDGQFNNDKISTTYGTATNPATPLGLPVNGDGRDLDGRDALYAKARLLWTPTENYEALLTYEFLDDDSSAKSNVNETPANGTDSFGIPRNFLFNALGFPGIPQTCDNPSSKSCVYSTGVSFRDDGVAMEQGQRMDVDGIYLNQKLTIDQGAFDLILGMREQKERLPGSFTGEAWPSMFDATRNLERDMRQAELRFTSTLEGPFQLALGAAYFENELDFRALAYLGFLEVLGVPGRNDLPAVQFAKQDGKAYGVYGEFYYDISDQLRATAGLRWSKEEKDFERGNNAFLTPDELQIWINSGGD